MKRQNTHTIAARALTCAAFATLMFAAGDASAGTMECYFGGEGSPAICGKAFEDADSNKFQGADEPNIGGSDVVVVAVGGGNVYTAETAPCEAEFPEGCGVFGFVLPPGTYTVCVPKPGDPLNTCADNPSALTVVVPEGSGNTQAGVPQDVGRPGVPVVSDNGPGTGTPGYRKNHDWPVATIWVGNKEYTKAQALGYMGKVGGDKSVTIFSSLVSAKLNVIIGNPDSCVKEAIIAADAWFTYWVKDGMYGKISGSSPAWVGENQGDETHQQLDAYNNGLLACAHHRN